MISPPVPIMPPGGLMPDFKVVFPVPMGMDQKFDMQMFSGDMPSEHKKKKWRGSKKGGKKPCRINEQEVTQLLKDNLVIFKNAEVKSIEKVAFQRHNGLILKITLQDAGKTYDVTAGYMPRWGKLNVLKVEETKEVPPAESALETGKELIGEAIKEISA